MVRDEAGEVLAGRLARTGPNLYGVIGRRPGADPDFDYSDLMLACAAMGAIAEERSADGAARAAGGAATVVWEEANFVGFVQNPTEFLREATGESGPSKMAYQVRDEQQAHDLYAFLATFSTEASAEGVGATGEISGDGAATGLQGPTGSESAEEGESASN